MVSSTAGGGVPVGPYLMYPMQAPPGPGQYISFPERGRVLNADGQSCGMFSSRDAGGGTVMWQRNGEVVPLAVPGSSWPGGINDNGVVFGLTMNPQQQVFRWDGAVQTIPEMPEALDINKAGVIAGRSSQGPALWVPGTGLVPLEGQGGAACVNDLREAAGTFGSPQVACFWTAAGHQVPIADSSGAWVLGFNNHSHVVGTVLVGGGKKGFFWNPADPLKIIDVPGACEYVTINEAGTVAGFSTEPAGFGFRWYTKDRDVQALPLPSGCSNPTVLGINLGGTIIGWSTHTDGTPHGLVWGPDNTPFDLGPGTITRDINDQGDVVGTSNTQPVIWVRP